MNNKSICSSCQFENPEGSVYCQHCGNKLKIKKKFFGKNTMYLAGAGTRGSSLAPLGSMAIEKQAKELGGKRKTSFPKISVVPLMDGSWFCPLCGDKNNNKDFCKGCGFEPLEP